MSNTKRRPSDKGRYTYRAERRRKLVGKLLKKGYSFHAAVKLADRKS